MEGFVLKNSAMIHNIDCLKFMRKQSDDSFAMVFGSPPYPRKGARYENGKSMKPAEWIDWMLQVAKECVRVSRGFVWFVVNNPVYQGCYEPCSEGLRFKAFEAGLLLDRPDIWHKNAAPNRNGDYFSNDYEAVICFKPTKNPKFNWQAIAEKPKFASGGAFRQRSNSGGGKRVAGSKYPNGDLAKPRDVFRVLVGGGHMGIDSDDSTIASKGKAPFPPGVPKRFIAVGSDPGETVFDPFAGAATTAVAALMMGRNFVGTEICQQEHAIGMERIARTQRVVNGVSSV